MFGSCSREGHNFPYGLVEALIGSVSQDVGQITVGHLVLVVSHLVVRREEVVHGHLRAHLDPEDTVRGALACQTEAGLTLGRIYCTTKNKTQAIINVQMSHEATSKLLLSTFYGIR